MRILQVIQELRPGGAERVVLSLLDGARAAGHEVAVAATPGPLSDDVHAATFQLPLLERRPHRLPAGSMMVARAMRAFRPHIVHAHNPAMALIAAAATRRGRRPGSLVTIHGEPEEDYPASARVLRLSGLPVVACGPGVAAALAEHGVDVAATIVNGVAPAPAASERADVEREFGFPPGRRLIVSVGRLVPQKHHDLAIRAVGQVPDAALLIVGAGPLEDDLRRLVTDSGLADRVRIAGGRADARALMGAADVCLLPSRWEGLPLVVLEAMAAGVPVIGTEVRGIRELITDGENGLLSPDDDPHALAERIRHVLADAGVAARLAAGGRSLAAAHSERSMVERYLTFYEARVG